VASTVGLMLTPVLGFTSEEALGPAADLGLAMQRTNILRDIGEDLARGRCYLPQDALAASGLTEADLRAQRVDARFIGFMRQQIAQTRELYRRAALGVPMLSGFGSQRMVRMMAAIYGGILEAIEAQGYDVFRARARVTTGQKVAIAARILFSPTPRPDAPRALSSPAGESPVHLELGP